MRQAGFAFTLIELLVVVVIIGILVSIGVGKYLGAADDAKYGAAKADMASLKKAMLEYKVLKGELPLIGSTVDTVAGSGTWASIIDALVASGDLGERINTDPWGNVYYYQDRDCNTTTQGQSRLISAGQDGVVGNTDDVSLEITVSCSGFPPTSTPTPPPVACSSGCGTWSFGACDIVQCPAEGARYQTRTCSAAGIAGGCATSRCLADPISCNWW